MKQASAKPTNNNKTFTKFIGPFNTYYTITIDNYILFDFVYYKFRN